MNLPADKTAVMPIVSIVTPCLNAVAFIDEAIRSVLDQKCAGIEHIVVDGGSTDGTLDVLSRYPHLKVIVERDSGLYEALNRGIQAAHGTFLGQLNADDCYFPGSLNRVLEVVTEHPGVEIISGMAMVGRNGHDQCGSGIMLKTMPLEVSSVTFGVPAINARFMARGLYERIGLYSLTYARAADREFLLRAIAARASIEQIPDLIYWYRSHDGSLTIGGNRRAYLTVGREHMSIARTYLEDMRLCDSDKTVIKRWHTEGATLELADALMARQMRRAANAIGDAITIDALALPRMLRFGIEKLVRMLSARRRV